MGSFAYSLHVKCDDADRVSKAIAELLAKDRWSPTDSPPDQQLSRHAMSGGCRAFWISAPVSGWVSVLDSDIAGATSLTTPLAEHLGAFTLLCMVNDSDSWMYALSSGDGLLEEFDSAEQGGAAAEISDAELSRVGQGLREFQARLTDGSLQQRLEQLNDEMIAAAPPEMQQCYARIKQGLATSAEVARYQQWAAAEAPKFMGRIQEVVGDFLPLAGAKTAGNSKSRKRKPNKAQRAAAQKRLDHLRPLLVAGVSDEQMQDVLDASAVFAEETLAQFLPLLGIPGFYAYLDYDHRSDASPAELSQHGIQFAHHLMFQSDADL